MEYQQIKTLLERYFQGVSSLEEEELLRQYFSGTNIDKRLWDYKPLFQFFVTEQKQQLDKEVADSLLEQLPDTPVRRLSLLSKGMPWVAKIAAVLALVVGMWWAYSYQQEPVQTATIDWSKYEITDEKEALRLTKGALFKASKKLNEGAQSAAGQMDRMQELGKFFK